MSYQNFDLKLSGNGEQGFFVEVIGSPQSILSNPVRLHLPVEEIDYWRAAAKSGLITRELTVTLGRHLFDVLFPREVFRIWELSKRDANREHPLRLRLDIRSAALACVPWETIHDGSAHIAMTGVTPLVRCVQDRRQINPSENTLPLNILMVISTPRDAPSLPNIEREADLIGESIAKLKTDRRVARYDVLRNVTKQRLQNKLAEENYHVLHYMGHGAFENDNGYLIFEDENGYSERIDGETVSYFFGDAPLRLLFLNSCETAVPSKNESFLGVAQSALIAGVPAVVAMQDLIADSVAAIFAHQFYKTLTDERPVEFCIAEGRKAINNESRSDWAIPVLFSNATDGLLWKPQHERQKRADHGERGASFDPDMLIYGEGDINIEGKNIFARNVNQSTTNYYSRKKKSGDKN